jgi:hypothetical protein
MRFKTKKETTEEKRRGFEGGKTEEGLITSGRRQIGHVERKHISKKVNLTFLQTSTKNNFMTFQVMEIV